MAEFLKVAREKKRMCTAHGYSCEGCPVRGDACGIMSVRYARDQEIKDLEKAVMKWAEENPAPVYPTWGEWLIALGIAGLNAGMIALDPHEAYQQIPEEYANALGLEPKEERHG